MKRATCATARFAAAAALAVACAAASASGIDKGPYLMWPVHDGVTVCWVSDSRAVGEVVLDGGKRTFRDAEPGRFHRVLVTGLRPHTRHRYAVTCSGVTRSGSFVTAARPDQAFRFAAYGDNRTQPDVHASVLARMRTFHPDFIVNTGDQVANGTISAQWDEFWRVVQSTFCDAPYFPALGNHERRGAPYFQYFDIPSDYSFDYGNAHFVCLDTNRPESEHAVQDAWLRKDLTTHQKATWRIVFFHHPMYTCVDIPARREEDALRAARLQPILEAGHVQLVLSGHDHDYQHHIVNGIHHVVTGGGGAPLYSVTPDTPYVKLAKKVYNCCEISVKGAVLAVRAVQPDGDVIEQFSIPAAISGTGSKRETRR